jgi:hypothetical protein
MFHLSRWLARHLNDPDLIIWIAGQGGHLHERFSWLVDDRLMAAGNEFPAALAAVRDWLYPLEHPHYIAQQLHQSGLSNFFPEAALELLRTIIDDQPWAPRELTQCLHAIAQANPALVDDQRYRVLRDYSRRRAA